MACTLLGTYVSVEKRDLCYSTKGFHRCFFSACNATPGVRLDGLGPRINLPCSTGRSDLSKCVCVCIRSTAEIAQCGGVETRRDGAAESDLVPSRDLKLQSSRDRA